MIGETPLIELGGMTSRRALSARVLAKAEFKNPLASVKDRIGRAMIDALERSGKLVKGGTLVEPTSGNTGIALAFVAAARGYKLVLTMPETMSQERRRVLASLGAKLVLTPGEKGMKGAIARAEELVAENPAWVMPGQFSHPANPAIHEATTGPEIWRDTEGRLDAFVAGVGTGGTITGVGRFLRAQGSSAKIIAVEPADSPVLSGGKPAPHKIQGIGAGFVPPILETALLDEILTMRHEEAGEIARELASQEGLFVGISSGANVAAALRVAAREEFRGKTIVTVLCDTGERYLSTWLFGEA
jgi:cysteine synthase A